MLLRLFFYCRYILKTVFFSRLSINMSEDHNTTTNNNSEPCSIFSEQDKELAAKAKQEYEGTNYDG